MSSLRRSVPLLFLAACGARSPLDLSQAAPGSSGGAAGGGGGAVLGPDGGVINARTCSSWVAAHDPVEVSNVASIMELMDAKAVGNGVLVGYADAQLPPVDPNWHTRLVAFGDGNLGPEETPLDRNTAAWGWSRVTLAESGGQIAALASDETEGMLFVPVDGNGAATGNVARSPGEAARGLLAAGSGFSALRYPFDDTGGIHGPVSLAALDPAGNVVSTRALLDPSATVAYFERVGLADGSFLFDWFAADPCPGCRAVYAQHFSASGDPLADQVLLQSFGPTDGGSYALAAGVGGALLVASSGDSPSSDLSAGPLDGDGKPTSAAQRIATLPNGNGPALAVAGAPGGDYIVAAIDGINTGSGNVYVQSVAADGTSEGAMATIAPVSAPQIDEGLIVVAGESGAMVLYESDVGNYGIEVFAVPLRCNGP
jgi:hypothetical protein